MCILENVKSIIMNLKIIDLYNRLKCAVENKDMSLYADPRAAEFLRQFYSVDVSPDFINTAIPVFLTNFCKKWNTAIPTKEEFLWNHTVMTKYHI